VTRDADANVLSTDDTLGAPLGGWWTTVSVINLGPALTPDWECHEKAWLNGWPPPAQSSIGERVLSSAVVFTLREPLSVSVSGLGNTCRRA